MPETLNLGALQILQYSEYGVSEFSYINQSYQLVTLGIADQDQEVKHLAFDLNIVYL